MKMIDIDGMIALCMAVGFIFVIGTILFLIAIWWTHKYK